MKILTEERKVELFNKLYDTLCEFVSASDLYDVLIYECGMTEEEIDFLNNERI